MINLTQFGKILIIFGIIFIIIGSFMLFFKKLGVPFGKLPGDLIIKKRNVVVYFPLMTSLIISVVISLILLLISRFK